MPDYGDDFASATIIDETSQHFGEIHAGNVEDFFRIVVPANTDYLIFYSESYWDMRGDLYDASEVLLVTNHNSGGQDGSGDNFYIKYDSPAQGTYYLLATSHYVSEYGEYSITSNISVNGVVGELHTTIEDSGGTVDFYDIDYNEATHDVAINFGAADYSINFGDPSKFLDIGGVAGIGWTNYNNWVIHDEYYKPKIIMMGSQRGMSTPLRSYGDPRFNIVGTIKEDGVALDDKLVRLYDRRTGELLGETRSTILGEYTFPNPLWEDDKYYVIAFDDVDNPVLQAVISDALVPITQ